MGASRKPPRVAVGAVGEQQHAVARGANLIGDAVEHRNRHGVGEAVADALLHDHGDDAAASGAQAAGARVGAAVVELAGGGEHPLAGVV
ncbi:hypothetical protein [Microcella putealis]|uniref:hypothetical protein n=1 Tax=Microcella putealis TaxID=337005 RepID=UPI0021AB1708|nr:hypothetical protein [Microcella putealis]